MRSFTTLLAVAVFSGLTACSQGTTESSEAPADAPPPAILAGVDLNQSMRAVGTEPFWGLEITPQTLSWGGVDQPVQTASNPGAGVQGTTATWRTETDKGTLLVLTLIATECSDGMSDRTFPLTAKVELGDQTFNGCAAPIAFFDSAPRP